MTKSPSTSTQKSSADAVTLPKGITISREVLALTDELVATRRDLHRHPEPAFAEERTASIASDRLKALGYQVATGVAKTGVVGVLEAGTRRVAADETRRTVLVRGDMDCLPVAEATGAPYASERPGLMHACGHDGHVAILLGVAKILAARRERLPGTVKLVFQPAEEGPGGAKPMIDAGVLEHPKVDAAVGLHMWNNLPLGKIGLEAGPIMAYADEFQLTVTGKGGHGAGPHQTVDPIVLAAQVITALQTIVSRKVDPFETAVLSLGLVKGGSAFNVIPSQVELAGTIRTYTPSVRDAIYRQMESIIKGITEGQGGGYALNYHFGYPATVNDPKATELVRSVALSVLGSPDAIVPTRSMGGEDMSYFLQAVPGCFFFLGSANEARKLAAPHHSPFFDFDEAALPIGVELLVRSVEKFLEPACGFRENLV